MYLYLIIYVAKWTKKLLGAFLWDMTVEGKGGDVVILQQGNVIHLRTWCSMRRLHGGPQTRMYFQT